MKKHFIHFLLILITPIALYINFFVAKRFAWEIEIKAWAYYSLYITVSKIVIIIICNYLIYKFLMYQKIWDKLQIYKFNNMTTTAFLLANFYFIFPLHNYLWLYVPLFSFSTIIVVGYIFFRKENGDKITLKYLFYVKKSDVNEKYNTKTLILTGFIYMLLHGIAQWFILFYLFNPYQKSIEYFMGDGFKVTFGQ